jgi:hypothetical protein
VNEPTETKGESKLGGVSVRGWLAVLLIVTVCGMALTGREVTEPLYTMSSLAIGFYFGQKIKT